MKKIYLITEDYDPATVGTLLADYGELRYVPCKTERDIIENCRDAEILISLYEPITPHVMDALTQLKFICLASIGYDAVDVDYATRKKIYVANMPHYCLNEVAEHTIALILALHRRLFIYNEQVQKGIWRYDCAGQDIFRLSTRTVGLLGFGKIAREVAKRIKPFGCRIVAYDPYVVQEVANGYGVDLLDFETLLEVSHIISLHLPLTKETRKLINKETISLMSQKPILVNCARGDLIDEAALVEALDSGQISGAGLDVFETEPPDLERCNLLNRKNVILTPHAAFYSIDSIEESLIHIKNNVRYFLQGCFDKIALVNKF